MKTNKEKAIDLILLGMAFYFIPLIIGGIVGTYFKDLHPEFLSLISLVVLSLILIGYIPFVKGCCLYISSKGHSLKWGFLGLFNLPGLSILLLIPTKKNAVNLEILESEGSENNPFKRINLLELTICFITLPFLFILILGIFCLLNNLNLFILINSPTINNLLSILVFVCFAFILFKEFQKLGLNFNQILGDKRRINLKLIGLIAVLELAFNHGFNSLLLYNLSFVFPEYVEEFLNKKYFTNISEIIAFSFSVVILSPLIEEFFFRGIVLQKWVIKWEAKTGVLTSSLLFAILHFRFDIISLFFGGIILSILYFKTRSLLAPILCHLFYNTGILMFTVSKYLSESAIERNALISVKDYQASIQPLLGQRVFLIAISVPFLIYFVYKNFPGNNAIIPYYANQTKIPETN